VSAATGTYNGQPTLAAIAQQAALTGIVPGSQGAIGLHAALPRPTGQRATPI
jgi:hypothetical protein